MKRKSIPIVIGAFGAVTKVLIQVLEDIKIIGREETNLNTAFFRSVGKMRILDTCCHLTSSERPSAMADVKNSQEIIIIIIIMLRVLRVNKRD